MLFYRAAVDLSRSTLNYVAGVIRRHRKAIGSAWRLLNPGQQALLVLAYLRDGLHYLVLDGTLIHTDRVKADRPYFSGKHRVHGMNVQVIASPDGTILWTSGAVPGKAHDLSAARIWGILRALEQAGIITLADKAYQGAGGPVRTPYKGKKKPKSQKLANCAHAKLRGPGERANAQLKSWKILRKLRCSPSKAGHLCKAIAVLQNHRVAQAPEDEKGPVSPYQHNCDRAGKSERVRTKDSGLISRPYGMTSVEEGRMNQVTERVKAYLTEEGVPFRLIEHEPAASAEEYHQVLGTRYEQQAKAIFLRTKRPGEKGFAILAIQAQKRADLDRVTRLLEVREARLGTVEQLRERTGCGYGELPPFGKLFGLPLLFDADLLTEEEIYFNAGDLGVSITLNPKDLVRAEQPITY